MWAGLIGVRVLASCVVRVGFRGALSKVRELNICRRFALVSPNEASTAKPISCLRASSFLHLSTSKSIDFYHMARVSYFALYPFHSIHSPRLFECICPDAQRAKSSPSRSFFSCMMFFCIFQIFSQTSQLFEISENVHLILQNASTAQEFLL